MRKSWAVLAIGVACGCSSAKSPKAEEPAPGDTRSCGLSGTQRFDGSTWGTCDEPELQLDTMSPDGGLRTQPDAGPSAPAAEVPDAEPSAEPPAMQVPTPAPNDACTCYATSGTTQEVACVAPAGGCSARAGGAAGAGCANQTTSQTAYWASQARELEDSYSPPITYQLDTFPFPSTPATCSGQMSAEATDIYAIGTYDVNGCSCHFADIECAVTLQTNVACL